MKATHLLLYKILYIWFAANYLGKVRVAVIIGGGVQHWPLPHSTEESCCKDSANTIKPASLGEVSICGHV